MLGRRTRHLIQHGEATVDHLPRRPVVLDGAREVSTKTRIQKVVIVSDLKACFGEKIGKILAQVI